MNPKNLLYFYLILFFIFVLIHKIIALIILFNLQIKKIRYFLNIIEPIFILCFYLFFKLKIEIQIILGIFLLAPINYWLFNQGFIYNFIDNTPQNNKIVKNVEEYGDIFINIVIFSYIGHFLYTLFF